MVAAVIAVMLANPPKEPRWLDKNIAGYALKSGENYPSGCFRDTKSGFFIMRLVDCDGAHIGLTLTRDRKMVAEYSFHVKDLPTQFGQNGSQDIKPATFRHLKTSLGIGIGDSMAQVRARLGNPTKKKLSGNRRQFTEWAYIWRDVKNGEGTAWDNTYIFKAGKLIEIQFRRDAVPGCGE